MDFTCILSKAYSLSPFEILKQDKDSVIMLVNYYILKGQENKTPEEMTGTDDIYINEKDADERAFWSFV